MAERIPSSRVISSGMHASKEVSPLVTCSSITFRNWAISSSHSRSMSLDLAYSSSRIRTAFAGSDWVMASSRSNRASRPAMPAAAETVSRVILLSYAAH